MDDKATNLPLTTDKSKATAPAADKSWAPLEDLRHEIDRLFDNFGRTDWLRPFRSLELDPALRRGFSFGAPAVDIVEKPDAFELTAELPGMEPSDVDVSLRNGTIAIKGEKRDEKEKTSGDYRVKERRYGAFERSFAVPPGVDTSAIEATYNKGLLTVRLPKTPEAQKPHQKIAVKAA